MTQEEEEQEGKEEQNEPKLSFLSLEDDNITMLLNGKSEYFVKLPSNISKKNDAEKNA